MKPLTLAVFIALILTACDTNISSDKDPNRELGGDAVLKFKSVLNGNWYQTSYIDSIRETKSPFRSQNAVSSIVAMEIDTAGIKGDSLAIQAVSIHEGGGFVVYFKPGITNSFYPTNISEYNTKDELCELGYRISSGDTSLIISRNDRENKLISETKYSRAQKSPDGPLQYMVNKKLFGGSYRAKDSVGKISILQFSDNGQIRGLAGFSRYYVLTDFVAGPAVGVDEVCFDVGKANQRCYGFVLKADSIYLYDVIENNDTSRFGDLKYRLVEQ